MSFRTCSFAFPCPPHLAVVHSRRHSPAGYQSAAHASQSAPAQPSRHAQLPSPAKPSRQKLTPAPVHAHALAQPAPWKPASHAHVPFACASHDPWLEQFALRSP